MVYALLKGRIGNNLFQIAAGISLAHENNTGFCAYVPDIDLPEPDNCKLSTYLLQFKNDLLRKIEISYHIPKKIHLYKEPSDLVFKKITYSENIFIDGYFQSAEFFNEEVVRSVYSMENETRSHILCNYPFLLPGNEITAINVRRGDFVKLPHRHPVCSINYYKSAINYIGATNDFLVISDDISWCKKQFKGNNYIFIDNEKPVIDLYLQTMCKNNIISNSSFSWWGAWLNSNPDKIVIAPRDNWTGKHHRINPQQKGLLPEAWIKLPNPLETKVKIQVIRKDIIRSLVNIKKSFNK